MNKKETAQILTYLREIFPQGAPLTENTVAAWQDLFSDMPFELVWAAAKMIARTWDGYTMPAPAAIIKQVELMNPNRETPIGLWRIAEKAIRRGTVFTRAEFDQLPGVLRRYFREPKAVKELSLLNQREIANERARFLREAPELIRQEEVQQALPADVRIMLESIAKQLPAGE